ncbi:MAG: MarR family transcriptional regulator [Emcibacteraceae bacterium]
MKLTPVMEKFILFWGEMGIRWGVNRSVAQIHALLYLAEKPLPADEIQDILKIARSNVSNSIKELQSWKLVHLVHVMGDRRDHFTAHDDPWDMVMAIAEGRKQREIDPALEMLSDCKERLEKDKETPDHVRRKINNMAKFLEETSDWYEQMQNVPRSTLKRLIKLGSKVVKFINK